MYSRPFALLEILTVLPEEVHSHHLRLGSNRRDDIVRDLNASLPMVLEFLKSILVEKGVADGTYKSGVFKCLRSWLTLLNRPVPGIEQHDVIRFAFQVLSDIKESHPTHELAADAVCALIESLDDIDSQAYPNLEVSIYNAVKALDETYVQTVNSEDICKVRRSRTI